MKKLLRWKSKAEDSAKTKNQEKSTQEKDDEVLLNTKKSSKSHYVEYEEDNDLGYC